MLNFAPTIYTTMTFAEIQLNETERLNTLWEYIILDTPAESDFDDLAKIASRVCNTPYALISFVDASRVWFKSSIGFTVTETERNNSFCTHVLNGSDGIFIVEDLSKDTRFSQNHFVTGDPFIRFCAAVPLVSPQGFVLGTLCVMDNKPSAIDGDQVSFLQTLSRQVVSLLENRRNLILLHKREKELKGANSDLEKLASVTSHDLKSPLNNIISLTYLLIDNYNDKLDEEGVEYLKFLNDTSYKLSDIVNGILSYTRSSLLSVDNKENTSVSTIMEEVLNVLTIPPNVNIYYKKDNSNILTSRVAVKQILFNICNFLIKQNNREDAVIKIVFHESKGKYVFDVNDNGPGVPEEAMEKLFDVIDGLKKGSKEKDGSSIGLAIVKRLLEKLGGDIKVRSSAETGTSFLFFIPG